MAMDIIISCAKGAIWEFRNKIIFENTDSFQSILRTIFKCKLLGAIKYRDDFLKNEIMQNEKIQFLLDKSVML